MKIMIKKEQIDKIDELQKQVDKLTYKLANEHNAVITLQENANAHRLKVGDVMKQNSELQKQVDELLNRRIEPKIFHCNADALETCPKVKQAVKDTAKEICDLILEYWQGHDLVECDWLIVAINEKYGVDMK